MVFIRGVVIVTAFALIFGASGGASSLLLMQKAYAAEEEGGKGKAQAGGPEKGRAEEAGGKHPDFEYVDLKPLVLPIITDRGLTQQVSLMVSLELPYGEVGEIAPFEPRLADAYLQDLYGALGAGNAMMQGNVIDVMAVKRRLNAVTAKVLGGEKFHDVLLQVVQQRPM